MTDVVEIVFMAAAFVLLVRSIWPPKATQRTTNPKAAAALFRVFASLASISLIAALTLDTLRDPSAPRWHAFAVTMVVGYIAAELGLALEFFRGGASLKTGASHDA